MDAAEQLDNDVLPFIIKDGGVLDAELLFGRALEEMGFAHLRFGASEDAPALAMVVGAQASQGRTENGVLAEWMMASDELSVLLCNKRLWNVVYRKTTDGFAADERWQADEPGSDTYVLVPPQDEDVPNAMRYLMIKEALSECLELKGDYVIDRERRGFYGDVDALSEEAIIAFPSLSAMMSARLFGLTTQLTENELRNRVRREEDEALSRGLGGASPESGV